MSKATRIVGVAAAFAVMTSAAWAQMPPAAKKDCPPQPSASPGQPRAPQSLEGEVVSVDPSRGTIAIRTPAGQMHEFRGNQDTLQDYKVGDRIALTLRAHPDC